MMKQEFVVANMKCEGCKKKVTKAIESVAGVKSFQVDLDSKHVTVDLTDPSQGKDVQKAIIAAGYDAQTV